MNMLPQLKSLLQGLISDLGATTSQWSLEGRA
jgi:hypothetical protein